MEEQSSCTGGVDEVPWFSLDLLLDFMCQDEDFGSSARPLTEGLVVRRLQFVAFVMRRATSSAERRRAAKEFLDAVANLVARLLAFLAYVLLRLLSHLLGRASADDVPVWAPVPLERTPEITPRGPNPAFPVNTHRGGHHRSTLGSVVLAA
ncbi:hypothetical protein RB200_42665 [Streptomyces sp. PmtG]